MTTKLSFEAPSDLSVGRIRITNGSSEIANWMATPDARKFTHVVSPGFYTAEISPAGVAAQMVVFEVKAGEDNMVVVPTFSSLMASSGNTTFLGLSDPQPAIEALFGSAVQVGPAESASEPADAPVIGADAHTVSTESVRWFNDQKGYGFIQPDDGGKDVFVHATALERAGMRNLVEGQTVTFDTAHDEESSIKARTKRIAIGLSAEAEAGRESFRPFAGAAKIELSETRLALSVTGLQDWSPLSGKRIRLSVAIEGVRVERLLLPMYRGGVQIVIVPSLLSSNDVELEVLPSDARLRALARALIAGTGEEAKAVLGLMRTADQQRSDGSLIDPWEAMLSALLSIRFPDQIPPLTPKLADELVALAPWAYDTHVIWARQHLFAAGRDASSAEMSKALSMLRRAQTLGAPYFSYSNELFAQLIDALHATASKRGDGALSEQAMRVRKRWLRERVLQSKAGVSFSWLRRDMSRLAEGLLAPDRSSTGKLGHSSTPLFLGHLVGGKIQFDPGSMRQPTKEFVPASKQSMNFGGAPDDCPALSRPVGPKDDPNLGRFGGRSKSAGFRLETSFKESSDGELVTITMAVVAEAGVRIPPGAVAWFCLHPTFPWQWVKVIFGNGRAVLSLEAWGGFTVGVWLPESSVELECDLSKHPDAPTVIRDR